MVLLADINLSNANIDWQALADATDVTNSNNDCAISSTPFTGVFDGDNHKITGFNPTVVLGTNKTFGLFCAISGATIKNVELDGTMTVSATGQADAGMLVGTSYNSTVRNVKVSGKLVSTGTSVAKRFSLGAVCGFAMAKEKINTVFEGATVNVEVEAVGGSNQANGATCAMYGGVVGFATAVRALACFNIPPMNQYASSVVALSASLKMLLLFLKRLILVCIPLPATSALGFGINVA